MKLYALLFVSIFAAIGCSSSSDNPSDNAANDSLLGVVWEIQNYTAESGDIATVADETRYQFLFESQTSDLQAFIGCVNFSDSYYELNDGFLTLTLGSSDDQECNTQTEEFASQNNAIMSLLQGGDPIGSLPLMYSVSNERLVLEAADGRLLELVAVSELMQQE